MCPDFRCQFLLPALVNPPLEHDANESLTAAPPSQLVSCTDVAGNSVCAPSWSHWLECTNPHLHLGNHLVQGSLKVCVFQEQRFHFPSILANTGIFPGSTADVTLSSKPTALVSSGTSYNVLFPGQLVQLNPPAVQQQESQSAVSTEQTLSAFGYSFKSGTWLFHREASPSLPEVNGTGRNHGKSV